MPSLPAVIGHRGAARIAPENTLAGFRAARAAGATWVELDVRFTQDGVPVVIHDPDLSRIAGSARRIARLGAAEVAAIDAGAWFAPRFRGAGIPTLAQALAELASLGLGVVCEIKPARGAARQVPLVADLFAALWPVLAPPPVFSSFSVPVLAALAALPAPPALALNASRLPGNWRALSRRLGLGGIHLAAAAADPAQIAAIKAAGLWVAVFTVNDQAVARSLWAAGADAMFTDDPAALGAAGVR